MYPKNRIPMYEGDGFIHARAIQDTAENSPVSVSNQSSEIPIEPGFGLSRAARNLLHKFAQSISTSVRHPQAKAIEN